MNGVRGCGYLFQHLMLTGQPLPQQLLAPFVRVCYCRCYCTTAFLNLKVLGDCAVAKPKMEVNLELCIMLF